MAWVIDGGSIEPNGAGGWTKKINYKNSSGGTKTVETSTDAAKNEIHKKTTIRKRNGDKLVKEKTFDPGPPPKTTRKRVKTVTENGVETETTTEWINGVKRKKSTRKVFVSGSQKGHHFLDTMEWDEKGKYKSKSHYHWLPSGKRDYCFNHPITLAVNRQWHSDLPGHLALPGQAGAGLAFGGSLSLEAAKEIAYGRVIDSSGKCLEFDLMADARFHIPAGFTSRGKAAIELIDVNHAVTYREEIAILVSKNSKSVIKGLEAVSESVLKIKGLGLATHPEVLDDEIDDDEEFNQEPSVIVNIDDDFYLARPLAYSDREVIFATPQSSAKLRVYVGNGTISNALKSKFVAPDRKA